MDQPIQSRARFDLVRYANCWEDADVLCDALEPAPGKRFLSIGSAGDNALALLAEGAEVVAADLSLAQIACIELRRAAFTRLDHALLLAFLGARPCDRRLETWKSLRDDLPEETRQFWDQRTDSLATGVIHGGKFENYFRKFRHYILPLVHSRKTINQWFMPKSRDQRIEFYNQRWDNIRWRYLFRIFFSRFVMGRLGRDPEFFRYVQGSVGERLLERTRYALTELTTHDNPYLTYILTGNYTDTALPRYLRPEKFDAIRAGLARLHVTQGSIDEVAKTFGKSQSLRFDGFNLSDIFEYLSPDLSKKVYGKLLDSAHPEARLVYWNMMVPRSCPPPFVDRIESRVELAQELFENDKAWFYSRFVIDEVK